MNELHKAIFLDRDGVINKERTDYVKTSSELEILSGVAESIKQLKDAGFLIIVITNQSAINRGLTNHDSVKNIHIIIQEYCKRNGTSIDAFFYCPHRPDENCNCRKPKSGLLLRAINEFKIDQKSSWMIGDNDSDLEAAKLVGCNSIKIQPNGGLSEAVRTILSFTQ
ncbi:MAG: D-glycero-alpha-D-manno-heptose-1,7-bisphosphate 7-phosphatase [Nitrosotalea sp.]